MTNEGRYEAGDFLALVVDWHGAAPEKFAAKAASLANALMGTRPVIHCSTGTGGERHWWTGPAIADTTHRARLMGVEKL